MDREISEFKELKPQEGRSKYSRAHYPNPKIAYVTPADSVVGHNHHKATHQKHESTRRSRRDVKNFSRCRRPWKALPIVDQVRGYQRSKKHAFRAKKCPYQKPSVIKTSGGSLFR